MKLAEAQERLLDHINNPPFVAPDIKMIKLAPLPEHPATLFLREKVDTAKDCVDLLSVKVDQLKLQKKALLADAKKVRAIFENRPLEKTVVDDLSTIPVLDIPLRKELRF